jgi:uncharacterized protein with ParB-like and HNH nuclease domain
MQITPHPTTLEKIFTGIDTRYQVPHYQRDYAWSVDNISELWTDVFAAWESETEYFVGAIVLNEENREAAFAWEIVDGQQRLASLTVLLSVVRDIAKAYVADPSHASFDLVDRSNITNTEKAQRAYKKSEPLIVHTAEPDNFYLQLNDKDHPFFFEKIQKPNPALLEKAERRLSKPDSRLLKAKKLFSSFVLDKILSQPDGCVKLDEFLSFCISKLVFLRIDVKTDDDAYLLFETLNDRGLDLSIADLVKNRLLLTCGSDAGKKTRVYNKWEKITTCLKNSRYQPQDFLRFYWIAFHGNATKREIYAKIKRYLSSISDVEVLVDEWVKDAEFFARISAKDLTYPPGTTSYAVGSTEQFYAEINSLRYSICYPLLICLNRKHSAMLPSVLPTVVSFLFRLISIGGFAAGRAEKVFLDAVKDARSTSATAANILKHFKDPEITDANFKKRILDTAFEDNDLARYLLAKIHEQRTGVGLRLTRDAHLEHVLPVNPAKWNSFDLKGKSVEDWIYSIGNMTLLEKPLNSSIQNDVFRKKVRCFGKQRGRKTSATTTAIPMTYEIAEQHKSTGKTWSADWIKERAEKLANTATAVWPDPNAPAAARRTRRTRRTIRSSSSRP